jgi:hypothetical protein
MKKYFNDPFPLTVRYTGKCADCGTTLKKGADAYNWPSDGKIYCISCGESEYRQFFSTAADQGVWPSLGNPFV